MHETLILRIGQSGFAGVTGKEYRLEPNGDYTVHQFINEETQSLLAKGQLDLDKLIPISQKIATADMAYTPPPTALYRGVNPVIFKVQYGEQAFTATLPPGVSLDQACAAPMAEAMCHLLELGQLIQASIPFE